MPTVRRGALVSVLKSASEQRYVLGVAFAAGCDENVRKGVDGRRDWMSAAEVEKAAWGFIDGRQVGVQHADGSVGAATVCESYIYRGPDWEIVDTSGNVQVIKSGDWLVGAILAEPSWRLFKAGLVDGWSVQGKARSRRDTQ